MSSALNKGLGGAREKGFTLIELMVALVLSFIVIYAAIDFFSNQQKVFRTQAQQARNQANIRLGLYYLAHDLSNAGFVGTPFGVEAPMFKEKVATFPSGTGGTSVAVPVRPFDFNSDTSIPVLAYPYRDRYGNAVAGGHTVDAVEIWANFITDQGEGGRLLQYALAGTNLLYASTAKLFEFTAPQCDYVADSCTTISVNPLGVVVTNQDGKGEYLAVSSVTVSGGQAQISTMTGISPPSPVSGYQSGSYVGPVVKRVYYLKQIGDIRWLMRRDYYSGVFTDMKIAEGIQDMQFTFDLVTPIVPVPDEPPFEQIETGVDPLVGAVDPVFIKSINVEMTALVYDVELKKPTPMVMNRRVRIANLGGHPLLRAPPEEGE